MVIVTIFIIFIFPSHLFSINFIDKWPRNTIVEIETIDSIFADYFFSFIYEKIPSFELPVVQDHCIFIVNRSALTPIQRKFFSRIVQIIQNKWLVSFAVSAGADSSCAVGDDFHSNFSWFLHQFHKTFMASKHSARGGSWCKSHGWSLRSFVTCCKLSRVSLEDSHEIWTVDTIVSIPSDILWSIWEVWDSVRSFHTRKRIHVNFMDLQTPCFLWMNNESTLNGSNWVNVI